MQQSPNPINGPHSRLNQQPSNSTNADHHCPISPIGPMQLIPTNAQKFGTPPIPIPSLTRAISLQTQAATTRFDQHRLFLYSCKYEAHPSFRSQEAKTNHTMQVSPPIPSTQWSHPISTAFDQRKKTIPISSSAQSAHSNLQHHSLNSTKQRTNAQAVPPIWPTQVANSHRKQLPKSRQTKVSDSLQIWPAHV